MRIQLFWLFCLFFSIHTVSNAAPAIATPPAVTITDKVLPPAALITFATLKIRDIQKLAGRKLTLKEKLAIKLYQWKLKKDLLHKKSDDKKDKGKMAMIFGIIGLVLLFAPIPVIGGLGAVVGIILALVLGYQARKQDPNDKRAKTAIILGWIGVGLIVLAIALLAILLASWTGGWG